MAARHAHPANVYDPTAWLHDETARLFCRQSRRKDDAACTHRDTPVPPDHMDGVVVILVTLHATGQIVGDAPTAIDDGVPAQPVGDRAFVFVRRHPIVELGPRQHPGDQGIER